MSDTVLVRGEISKSVAWSRTLVPLGVILGAGLFWIAPPPTGLVIGLIFGVLWISLEIYAAIRRSHQLWVRDTGDGFDLIDRNGERHIGDNQINSVSLKVVGMYNNGVQVGTQRVFTVWSDLEPDPIQIETKLKEKQSDPLVTLVNRLIQNFQQRTEADLLQGEVLAGAGWRLDQDKLSWGKGDTKESIRRSDISACEEFDGHICVWRRGQDEAIAKFKLGTRNLCLLPLLLQPAPVEGEATSPGDQTGLGRILFERKPGKGTCIGLGCLGMVTLLVGGLMIVGFLVKPIEVVVLFVGLAILLAGAGFAYWGYAMRFKAFRCHERGVVQLGMRKRKVLRYSETGAFTYAATRQYYNGAYIGTTIAMTFTPLPESDAPKIAYSTSIKNEDAAIEELRNFISRAIAVRMLQSLADGHEVPWTPNLTFEPAGIRYRPSGFIGRKEAKLLPTAEFGGWNMDQGVFYLFQKGEKKAVVSEQAAAVNFYPGFFLLMTMLQE